MKARFATSVLVGALVAFGAAGCTFVTPQATLDEVETSNGVNGDTGEIAVRNATLITNNDGKTASLLASMVNVGDRAQQVSVQYENAKGETLTAKVYVPAGRLVSIGADNETQLILTDIVAPAGSLYPLYFQTGNAPGKQLLVPVLDTVWEEYEGLAPPAASRFR